MNRRRNQQQDLQTTFTALMVIGLAALVGWRVYVIGARLGAVERESEFSKRNRMAKSERRDFLFGKVYPIIAVLLGATLAAVVSLGIGLKWFR